MAPVHIQRVGYNWKTCEKQPEEDEEASRQALGSSEPTFRSPKLNKRQLDFQNGSAPPVVLTLIHCKIKNKNSCCYISLTLYMDLPCKNRVNLNS